MSLPALIWGLSVSYHASQKIQTLGISYKLYAVQSRNWINRLSQQNSSWHPHSFSMSLAFTSLVDGCTKASVASTSHSSLKCLIILQILSRPRITLASTTAGSTMTKPFLTWLDLRQTISILSVCGMWKSSQTIPKILHIATARSSTTIVWASCVWRSLCGSPWSISQAQKLAHPKRFKQNF